jgi:hypothetical protein
MKRGLSPDGVKWRVCETRLIPQRTPILGDLPPLPVPECSLQLLLNTTPGAPRDHVRSVTVDQAANFMRSSRLLEIQRVLNLLDEFLWVFFRDKVSAVWNHDSRNIRCDH